MRGLFSSRKSASTFFRYRESSEIFAVSIFLYSIMLSFSLVQMIGISVLSLITRRFRRVSPVKEGLAQITARLFEAATEMAERMKDAKFVPGSLAKRARQMCEWYQLMNFTGDSSLEEVLTRLGDAAGRETKQRSPEEMRNSLNEILRATTVQSRKLLDEDRLSALEL